MKRQKAEVASTNTANLNEGTKLGKGVNPVQIEKYLKGMDYPASKQDLVNKAKQEGADENVIRTFKKLPDREYNRPVRISEAIGRFE